MRFTLAFLALAASAAFAAPQSLVLKPGLTAFTPIPALGGQSLRIEMRIHDRTPIHGSNAGWIFESVAYGPFISNHQGSTNLIACQTDVAWVGLRVEKGLPSDFTLRLQRDTINKLLTCEIWDSQTGNRVAHGTGKILNVRSLAAGRLSIGSKYNDSRVAYLRVFSTIVPLNSRAPSVRGDVLNWEFEKTGVDTSGTNRSASWTDGVDSKGVTRLVSSSSVIFAETPTYNPVCNAGVTNVFRAGESIVLDGTASYTSDDSTPVFSWKATAQPTASRLTITGQTLGKAVAAGGTFGTHDFTLAVTDGTGRSSTCSVSHGVVAYDDAGVVVLPETTPAERARNQLLGKLIAHGKNPWAWADDRHRAMSQFFGEQLLSGNVLNSTGTALDWWNKPDAGTVTVTYNSTKVYGVGTRFSTDLCGKDGNPRVPRFNGSGGENSIVIWYPDSRTYGRVGRDLQPVVSCESDTELTLKYPYKRTQGTQTGLRYTFSRNRTGYWMSNITHANFYDNVLAHYIMYYRTGLKIYLTYARTLADRWWQSPYMDQGRACPDFQAGGYCRYPRDYGMTGLTIRALEKNDPDMWKGLRLYWDMFRVSMTSPGNYPRDIRENGYEFLFVAQCAIADPDPANATLCRQTVETTFTQRWMPSRVNAPGHVLNGVWGIHALYNIYEQVFSWYPRPCGIQPYSGNASNCGTVTVTEGSPIVVGNGTKWTRQMLNSGPEESRHVWSLWVTPGGSNSGGPNGVGDAVAFRLTGCAPGRDPNCPENSVIDETHLRLNEPYHHPALKPGESRTGLQWGVGQYMGFGTQPFMLGILAQAFFAGHRATGNIAMQDAALGIAEFLVTSGIDYATSGVYYSRGYPICRDAYTPGPMSSYIPGCSYDDKNPSHIQRSRFLSGELVAPLAEAYKVTRSPRIRESLDKIYNAAFAKPGWASPYPTDRNIYLMDLDDGGYSMLASKNKDYGFWFGMGGASQWPAYRAGAN